MTDVAPLRLVVFDVDGTLVDSQAHILSAMGYAYEAVGQARPSREAILGIVGLSLPVAMARLSPELSTGEQSQLVDAYKDSFANLRQTGDPAVRSPLYPGARDAVEALRPSDEILLGVATGKSRRGLDHVLKAHGLENVFVTEQVADHHPSKPHPSMLQAALAETGVEARDAIMIGDTTFDIEMGRAAGFATIGVSWGYHAVESLVGAGADVVIDRFEQLAGALERIWES